MKMSNNTAIIALLLFWFMFPTMSIGQKLLENHIEVVEQFSKVKSKSKSLASYAKRNLEGSPALDTVELLYMELKESSDGAISRYKSIIDNPKLAKKTEATITANLNDMNEELGKFAKYVTTTAKSNIGFQQMNPIALISTFSGLGAGLLKEITSMQQSKRDVAKKELEQYQLNDWVEIE